MGAEARQGLPWSLLSYGGSKLVSILTTLVLARLLAPSAFGLLALATIATNFLYWVADSGLSNAVVVRRDFDERELGTMLTLIAFSGLAAAVLAVALSPLANIVFQNDRVAPILIAVSAVLPIGSLTGFYEALLMREMLFRRRALAMIGQALLSAAVSIALAVAGDGVWSLVLGQIAGYGALLIAFAALAPIRVRPRLERAMVRESWLSGRGFLSQGMLQYIRLNVDTVTVGIAFGQRRLGYYSMANRFGDLVYWVISHPIGTVTFPSFAKRHYESTDIHGPFLQVLGTVALVSAPVGILMSAAAEPFTHAIFGSRWLPMAGPLAVMGLWAMVRQIDTTLQWLLNSISQAGAMAWVSAAVLPPLIVGCWLAAEFGGLTAIALVPLGDTILSATITGLLVQRHAHIMVRDQARAVTPAIAASIPTWIVTWVVGRAIGPSNHAVVALIAALAAGLVTYLVCVRIIAPSLLRALVVAVNGMMRRGPASVPST